MFLRNSIGDFDVFVHGEYFTTYYHVTYDHVHDLVCDFFGNDDYVEIVLLKSFT